MPESRDVPPAAVAGSADSGRAGRAARAPIVLVRGLQFGIDLALSCLLAVAPLLVVPLLPRNPDGTLGALLVSVPLIGLAMAAGVVLSWCYWSVLPVRRGGRTLAMGWLGLRVVDLHGRPVGIAAMTLRWMALLVDAMLLGLVGLAAMLLTPRAQRFGDLLAATLVVRDQPVEEPDPRAG